VASSVTKFLLANYNQIFFQNGVKSGVLRVIFVAVPEQSHKFKRHPHLKRDEDKENV
jgi:hypothetical protein